MIAVIGDLHGTFATIDTLSEYDIRGVTFIQVGDFGLYKQTMKYYPKTEFPVYFVDGNHEDHDWLHDEFLSSTDEDVIEIIPNLHYVRRGSVLEIDGLNIGFLGGACSVDKFTRLRNGSHWSEKETITDVDALRMIENGKDIDVLITHSPPTSVTLTHFGPLNKSSWGLPPEWYDESAMQVQRVWDALDRPQIYCGHLHGSAIADQCRVLDINEIHTISETRSVPSNSNMSLSNSQ